MRELAFRRALSQADVEAIRALAAKDSAIVMSRNWDVLAAEYYSRRGTDASEPACRARTRSDSQLAWQFPPISSFSFHLDDLLGAGSVAYLRGTYTITVAPPGVKAVSDTGKELVVLRKQNDGYWLRRADAWNTSFAGSK